jgi:hypothetical protein
MYSKQANNYTYEMKENSHVAQMPALFGNQYNIL